MEKIDSGINLANVGPTIYDTSHPGTSANPTLGIKIIQHSYVSLLKIPPAIFSLALNLVVKYLRICNMCVITEELAPENLRTSYSRIYGLRSQVVKCNIYVNIVANHCPL